MDNSKLINEKLELIMQLAREISELEKEGKTDIDVTLQLLFVQPHATDPTAKELFGMSFGTGKTLMEANARAFKQRPALKEIVEDAIEISKVIDTPFYDLMKSLSTKANSEPNKHRNRVMNDPNIN